MPMSEEHKQHLRESAMRRIAAMDEKKRAAFNARCAAGGRKSWALRSAADKAAQIARINTPEVRKRASDANKAKHRAKTEEKRKAQSKSVEGAPIDGASKVVRFDSASSAARWVLSTVGGRSFAGTRHNIYEAVAGRRKTAYGCRWRRVEI